MNRSNPPLLKLHLVSLTDGPSCYEMYDTYGSRNFVSHKLFRGQYSKSSVSIRTLFFNSTKASQPSRQNKSENGSLGVVEYIFHTDTLKFNDTKNISKKRSNLVDGFNVSMLVLVLICLKTKKFEFVRVPIIIDKTTIGDVLDLIPSYCQEKCVKEQNYRGICRAANGIEILDRSLTLIGTIKRKSCKILTGEVLLALPQTSSATECMTLAQGILKHPLVAQAFTIRKTQVMKRCSSNISQKSNENNALETIDENIESNRIGTDNSNDSSFSRNKIRKFFTRSIKSARTA